MYLVNFALLEAEDECCFQHECGSCCLRLTGIYFSSLGPWDWESTKHWEKSFCRGSVAGINWPLVQFESPHCAKRKRRAWLAVGAGPGKAGWGPHAETPSPPLTNTAVDNLSFRDSAQRCGAEKGRGLLYRNCLCVTIRHHKHTYTHLFALCVLPLHTDYVHLHFPLCTLFLCHADIPLTVLINRA